MYFIRGEKVENKNEKNKIYFNNVYNFKFVWYLSFNNYLFLHEVELGWQWILHLIFPEAIQTHFLVLHFVSHRKTILACPFCRDNLVIWSADSTCDSCITWST